MCLHSSAIKKHQVWGSTLECKQQVSSYHNFRWQSVWALRREIPWCLHSKGGVHSTSHYHWDSEIPVCVSPPLCPESCDLEWWRCFTCIINRNIWIYSVFISICELTMEPVFLCLDCDWKQQFLVLQLNMKKLCLSESCVSWSVRMFTWVLLQKNRMKRVWFNVSEIRSDVWCCVLNPDPEYTSNSFPTTHTHTHSYTSPWYTLTLSLSLQET